MANLVAYQQFKFDNIDLNFYIENLVDHGLSQGQGFVFHDNKYADYGFVVGDDGASVRRLDAYGNDIAVKNGTVTGGTLNAIGETEVKGAGELWYIDDISISAVAVMKAASIADNTAFLKRVFAGNDTITLSSFDDEISGFSGDDKISGGDGNDLIEGGPGNDVIDGGADNDTASYENAAKGVRVKLTSMGVQQDTRGDGLDTLVAIENLTGSVFNDFLKGDAGGNTLSGLSGNDVIMGSAGADMLLGGEGDDKLRGGGGQDVLEGGPGRDTLRGDNGKDVMTGGADKDIFRFKDGDFAGSTKGKADTITDFSKADGDRINLMDIDAVVGGGDDAFSFIDTNPFSGTAGELRYVQIGADTFVQGDTAGNGAADFMIKLANFTDPMAAGDFIF